MLRACSPRKLAWQLQTTFNSKRSTSSFLTMPKGPKRKQSNGDGAGIDESELPKPPVKRLKSTKTKIVDPPQYAVRAPSLWKVGAHVSAAGGIENAIINAASIGANSFALFVKSQRKWSSPPLSEASISGFKARLVEHGYDPLHILPHGSYLINLGNPDAEKRQKSYDCFLDDLKRCESLGLLLYNFHPGSTVGEATTDESISLIAGCINEAHRATEKVAGAGNIIGGDFNHLAKIIEQVDDKTRVGVCLDTCHMFAAGYDLRTKEGWENIVTDFDQQVGLSYLRGMHLNDSKTDCNSKKDRHENIGIIDTFFDSRGHVGIQGFHHILNDARFQNIPLILETPSFEKPEVWATEITALNSLSAVAADADADEQFVSLVDSVREVVKKAGGNSKTSKAPKKAAVKRGRRNQSRRIQIRTMISWNSVLELRVCLLLLYCGNFLCNEQPTSTDHVEESTDFAA
ncbi:AP-endonuc-2 domain-containing protein [Mycena sanguinolenta]|uniref:Apurinic-apyrimidinic endonuclease 1 n=1 Tax=Mycena sanguinolenta TaxID=230812 RepID=A0A8H6YH69_9AGAR|nr:AP-endonuc-2 domain-containing protein [Mycena sanguinolenta]